MTGAIKESFKHIDKVWGEEIWLVNRPEYCSKYGWSRAKQPLRRRPLLIVNPNNRLNSPFAAIEPPLWAGLTASAMKADILDAEALDLSLERTEEAIREREPRSVIIVVMGNNPSVSSTPKMPVAEALADRIADMDVALTGLHPVAAGSKYRVIKKPFSGFPMMPWKQLPMDQYRAHNWHCLGMKTRSHYASIYTSLGCPFNCYYCNIHALYGERKIRFRPLRDIEQELCRLAFSGIQHLKIWDELFALDEKRVIAISDILRHYAFNIWAYARLDTVTPRMLKALKRGGINWLAYGFESIKDGKCIQRSEEVINMTRAEGINIMANFMFGIPGTNREDDRRSLEFAKEHLFEFVNFYDAKPYPGSKWYEDIKADIDWQQYNQYLKISPFRQQAFEEYFTNPAYLSMVKAKWGTDALAHIRSMVDWKFAEVKV